MATQWLVLCAEACSPLMLWLRGRALYAYVGFFAMFHLTTYLTIKIHFLPLVVCLLAFLPLEQWERPRWLRRRRSKPSEVQLQAA